MLLFKTSPKVCGSDWIFLGKNRNKQQTFLDTTMAAISIMVIIWGFEYFCTMKLYFLDLGKRISEKMK